MQGNRSGKPEGASVRTVRLLCLSALGILAILYGAAAYVAGTGPVLWIAAGGVLGTLLFAWLGIEPIARLLTRAQQRVRETDQHMRAVLDAAAEGILTLNADDTIAAINPAAERMFGYLPHEAVGFGVHLLVDALEVGAERNSTSRTRTRAAVGRRRDGSEFPVQIGLSTARVEGVELHILTVQDGSVQAEAETAIRESEMRTAAILSSAADPYVIIDGEGRILDFNPAAERVFAWERRQVLDKEFADVLIPHPRRMAIRRGLREAAQAQNTTGTSILNQKIELAARRKDGREVAVELLVMPIDLGSGRQFAARLRDLSGQVVDHEVVDLGSVDDDNRAQAVVESAPAAMLTIDATSRIEWINAAGERLFGWPRKELVGADIVRLTPADQGTKREALFDGARAMLRLGVGAQAEMEGVRRDGTRFPMHVSASRMRVGDRALFVWVVRDLSKEAVDSRPLEVSGGGELPR
ncbi:MAG: PAS domain S-box protein [Planctomycetes bacterium]|nr:PAS domain S-box protein [Planctomycetota bacterium]